MTKRENRKLTPDSQPTGALRRWLIPTLVLIILAVIGLFVMREQPQEPKSTNEIPLRTIGPETAHVTIIEYADFGCFTCKAWHQFGIREQVIETYGDQVRFVWHDFPVITAASPKAAEAGFCAHDQGQFWVYHDILYANAPNFSSDALKAYAEQLGLETSEFSQCLDSGRHQVSVQAELAAASDLGLRSVPSFMVNDTRLIGPPSFEQLAAIIDEILAEED
jgi:protein-disulfide isomerase